MTKDYPCFFCFANAFGKLIEKHGLTNQQKKEFTQFIAQLGANETLYSSPEFSVQLHRKLKQYSGNEDVYAKEKNESNKKAKELAEHWLPEIKTADNPFNLALRLSIAGNIMDYGAPTNRDIEKNIEYVINTDFAIDHSKSLQNEIQNAKQILYLGDNAGEIVFDKLFIGTLNHPNIYFAYRGFPIINDVTIKDVIEFEMGKVAKPISNGYDAPSTLLEKCSPEFQVIWNNSDLIISKGHGNLEGLIDEKSKKIYFLLMVKCDVIAEHLHVKKGDFVVKCNWIN
ncbi:MAG: ARMT1-like domain-containing protein [Bacteroidales bacterium]